MARNFANKAGYEKWLAFGHMHGVFAKTPGNQKVTIAGRLHKVKHNR